MNNHELRYLRTFVQAWNGRTGKKLIPDGEPWERFAELDERGQLEMLATQIDLRLEEIQQLRRGAFDGEGDMEASLMDLASEDTEVAEKAAERFEGSKLNRAMLGSMVGNVRNIRIKAGAAAIGMADLREKGLVETTSNSGAHDYDLMVGALVGLAGQPNLSMLRRCIEDRGEDPQELVNGLAEGVTLD
ncbi:hypothetical protein HBA54_03215 [Pelagibius litoralis]|uniref:Uncharacterized protein n=1 Tax=Pelagibius litoralis TaxID=374515 RepID=A0A967EUV4_9PROT|nr:hypothetical protein [Pelagibius litoralis]NIA67592.1 hypothetical protein [Pelagibius litoralis]